MRIVGGKWRRHALGSVGKGDEKSHLRPTTDRVRESLFNVLAHGRYPDLEGARVLDLFAGTGALGLESLSRGARHVTFVEKAKIALGLIHNNIEQLQCLEQCTVLPKDSTKLGVNTEEPYDICFLDPPYGKGLGELTLEVALQGNWFNDQTLIILEEGKQIAFPHGFRLSDVRRYGDTHVHFGFPLRETTQI